MSQDLLSQNLMSQNLMSQNLLSQNLLSWIPDGYPEVCGRLDAPGLWIGNPGLTDYSQTDTTIDQIAIEDQLERMDLTDRNILHIGVGNSRFAERFASRVSRIDGLTVSQNEKDRADSLGIANYRVYLLNKHSREFILRIEDKYDYVIDNNIGSFACCKYHFYLLLDNLLSALGPDGRILTEEIGLRWRHRGQGISLTYSDLISLEKLLPISVSKIGLSVYSIRKARDRQ